MCLNSNFLLITVNYLNEVELLCWPARLAELVAPRVRLNQILKLKIVENLPENAHEELGTKKPLIYTT